MKRITYDTPARATEIFANQTFTVFAHHTPSAKAVVSEKVNLHVSAYSRSTHARKKNRENLMMSNPRKVLVLETLHLQQ